MMRVILVLAVVLGGCVGDEADDTAGSAVSSCRASAASACASIGYGDNEPCLLAFAQDCSPEDAAAANETCCASDGLPIGSECRLTWR